MLRKEIIQSGNWVNDAEHVASTEVVGIRHPTPLMHIPPTPSESF